MARRKSFEDAALGDGAMAALADQRFQLSAQRGRNHD
jgi:hypothetical protein